MPSRLYPESKRALLDQAMRVRDKSGNYSNLFIKLLKINHSFVNVGRYYKISQLVIQGSFFPHIYMFFGSNNQNRTQSFELSVEKARQVIELFQIQMFKINNLAVSEDRCPEFCSLIDCIDAKIDLDFSDMNERTSGDKEIEFVNRFWEKITTLRGPVKLLSSRSCQSSKRFDKLSVSHVNSIAHLKTILCYEVKELEIDYSGDLSTDEVNKFLETAPKTKTKKFKLIRRTFYGKVDVIIPLVHFIVGISPNHQKLEIEIDISTRRIAYTMHQLVTAVIDDYETFAKAKNVLLKIPFEFDLSISASHNTIVTYKNTGDNWFDRAKKEKPELSKGVYEVKDNGRRTSDGIVIQSVDESLKSTFTVAVRYEARDDRDWLYDNYYGYDLYFLDSY